MTAVTPYDFRAAGDGLADDTAAVQAALDTGRMTIPDGSFRVNGPLWFGPGCRIEDWTGRLLYRRGWSSGHLLRPRPGAAGGLFINARGHHHIVYDGASDLPRKGLGIRGTPDRPFTGFVVRGLHVEGGVAPKGINLFGFEVLHGAKGRFEDCYSAVQSGQQGCDGMKIHGASSDIDVLRLETASGDDAISVTQEAGCGYGACVAERIRILDCSLGNVGHAAAKLLVTQPGGTVRHVRMRADFKTTPTRAGAGTPLWFDNQAGTISDIDVSGIVRLVAPGPNPTDPMIVARGIPRLSIALRELRHNSRVLLRARDCPGLDYRPGRISALGKWVGRDDIGQ